MQLAICWEPRESGATETLNQVSVKMRPVRAISRKGQESLQLLESSEAKRQPPRAIEAKIWSEPHGDMRRTRAKFLVG
jgi:hypothetical protein